MFCNEEEFLDSDEHHDGAGMVHPKQKQIAFYVVVTNKW